MKKHQKPIRIGFDLDGVLLYNPARIIRRPVVIFKHIFIPKREKKFFVPKTPLTQFIFNVYFYMSFVLGDGLLELEKIIKSNNIDAYVITGRFNFAKDSAVSTYNKLNSSNIFKKLYVNESNMQPHLFKEKMINELDLDIFVEDNIDIVRHLSKIDNVVVLWICNIFDAFVYYPHKFTSLNGVANKIDILSKKK